MTYESVSAFAAVGTFVVIAATAIAAMIQLRHLRVSNQLESLLTVIQMPLEPKLNEAFNFCSHDYERMMHDENFRNQLADRAVVIDRSVHKELYVCDYYERIGSAIKYGLISADFYLDNSSPLPYWRLMRPAIDLMRRGRGPWIYENFEYLAVLAQQWEEAHADGNYPVGVPRFPIQNASKSGK